MNTSFPCIIGLIQDDTPMGRWNKAKYADVKIHIGNGLRGKVHEDVYSEYRFLFESMDKICFRLCEFSPEFQKKIRRLINKIREEAGVIH